jgi:hypothetical protein
MFPDLLVHNRIALRPQHTRDMFRALPTRACARFMRSKGASSGAPPASLRILIAPPAPTLFTVACLGLDLSPAGTLEVHYVSSSTKARPQAGNL